MCAGITTYNALRNSGASPGDVVAILGMRGLGHLGIQFASKMGFNTVARVRDKEEELTQSPHCRNSNMFEYNCNLTMMHTISKNYKSRTRRDDIYVL